MTEYEEKLSAFLDGELTEAEAREIEAALERDPALQAELEQLMAADTLVQEAFADIVAEPVPLELAAAVRNAPEPAANLPHAPSGVSGWLAASVAMFMLFVGGTGGYFAANGLSPQVAAAPGWLADIADYHAVYAAQARHLVEVPASESEHLQQWLTASVGAEVRIPDLASNGLTFEGGRLLVAAGKPVAQLMYTDGDGAVVALCLIATETPRDGFGNQTLNGFDMVSWGGRDANFVIVGDTGRPDLTTIAEAAAQQV